MSGPYVPKIPILPALYCPKQIMEIVNRYRKLGLTHMGFTQEKLVDEWANEELAKWRKHQENKDGHTRDTD